MGLGTDGFSWDWHLKPILTAVTDPDPRGGPTAQNPWTSEPRGWGHRCLWACGLGSLHDEPRGPANEELAASDIQ